MSQSAAVPTTKQISLQQPLKLSETVSGINSLLLIDWSLEEDEDDDEDDSSFSISDLPFPAPTTFFSLCWLTTLIIYKSLSLFTGTPGWIYLAQLCHNIVPTVDSIPAPGLNQRTLLPYRFFTSLKFWASRFSCLVFFISPWNRLSWPSVSFWVHVNTVYCIVSYRMFNDTFCVRQFLILIINLLSLTAWCRPALNISECCARI